MSLALTYHGVDDARGALSVSPELFEEHLETIAASAATVVTIRELVADLRSGESRGSTGAICFDDAFASVVRHAAPRLVARAMKATIFCVAGCLGGTNAWPSQRDAGTTRDLARADELAELAAAGFEIGSHGVDHAPLVGSNAAALRREIVDARRMLEDAVGTPVTSFAYPYGAGPSPDAATLVRETYDAACTTPRALVGPNTDPLLLPRFDIHYLRRPERLARVLRGEIGTYLHGRFLSARARRMLRRDYDKTASGGTR